MAYKKPQMVAKSVAKKIYVAGCPTNTLNNTGGGSSCFQEPSCEIRRIN